MRFIFLFLFCATAACTPARDASTPQARAVLFEEFRKGTTTLNCQAACAWAWMAHRDDMRRLDGMGAWRELAVLVAATDYQKDLAYWYLGRAAEGLGLRRVAAAYYQQAYTLTTGPHPGAKCRTTDGDCAGVDLLARLPERLRALAAHKPVAAQMRSRTREDRVAPAAAPTLPVVRSYLRPRHEDCSSFSIQEAFRGELPGIPQPVLVATYAYTDCRIGNFNQSTFGVFVLENGQVRNLRPEPLSQEGVARVSVDGDRITVATLTPGPNDGRCCPTVHGQKIFAVQAGRIMQLP